MHTFDFKLCFSRAQRCYVEPTGLAAGGALAAEEAGLLTVAPGLARGKCSYSAITRQLTFQLL